MDEATRAAIELYRKINAALIAEQRLSDLQDLLDLTRRVTDDADSPNVETVVAAVEAALSKPPQRFCFCGQLAQRALGVDFCYLGGPTRLALGNYRGMDTLRRAAEDGSWEAVLSGRQPFPTRSSPRRNRPHLNEGLWLIAQVDANSEANARGSFLRQMRIVAGYFFARGLADLLPFRHAPEVPLLHVGAVHEGKDHETPLPGDIQVLNARCVTQLYPETDFEKRYWKRLLDDDVHNEQPLDPVSVLERRLVGLTVLLEKSRSDQYRAIVNALELLAYGAGTLHDGAAIAVLFAALEAVLVGKRKLKSEMLSVLLGERFRGRISESDVSHLYDRRSRFLHDADMSDLPRPEVFDLTRDALRSELLAWERSAPLADYLKRWTGVEYVYWTEEHPRLI